MNRLLRNILKIQICSLTGFDFQNFVVELYLSKYGEKSFLPTRRIKDKGADGIILNERCVIACYGAEKYDKKRFEKKIINDFNSYKLNFEEQYSNWQFITNQYENPIDVITLVDKLKPNSSTIGVLQLISIIENLQSTKRRRIAKYLKVENEYIAQDYINEILEDLLQETINENNEIAYKDKPLYIETKIELNFITTNEIENAQDEYDSYFDEGIFNEIHNLLNGYEDNEIGKIKLRIKSDFEKFTGTFRERINLLTEKYLDKYSIENDDDYRYYIRSILFYVFEQCFIGIKTEQEK